MVVLIRVGSKKNAWVFLQPLTWDLWVTSGCFFISIGFIVWVLEHRINENFRGQPLHYIGTSFWFSFSTLVFAHRNGPLTYLISLEVVEWSYSSSNLRERVVSNWTRFVVLIWCFVVLILSKRYNADSASLKTVQQLQPTVTDVNELLRKRENVGYQDGSFVQGILQGLKFDQSKMKIFKTSEDLNELFTKGSANGGTATAFDEIPYVKLFLEKYCNKYTSVASAEPTFRTDGFGFVFPKGSPLVSDVSKAIFKSHRSLSLGSFWGLFLITGVSGVLAFIIFIAEFLYQQRNVLCVVRNSVFKRILQVLRNFDRKDLPSHTFKQSELKERSIDGIQIIGDVEVSVEASPNTNCSLSSSN
ncbi:hypothetical protein SLEP1_g20575 [Rubroshorea leprosula]|uniref:Ionotropic glutamate receptor C-terminal domain-containing protein n=1 Tax=Rubroshorea leprosula TaxID=152421 RepID=A0AAV5J348_9ROSI|nr:hypothetical protein SLEP1_g20575 [Rubroshorea leprosula]